MSGALLRPSLHPVDEPRSRRANNAPRIAELFDVPGRYLRSVHLERDFDDIAALEHYVVTPSMVDVFTRILAGLRLGSGRRAWRVTGDYGTGKSSFALVLAHLLRAPDAPLLAELRQAIESNGNHEQFDLHGTQFVPVLVTGTREPIVPNVAQAIGRALDGLRTGRGRPNQGLEVLRNRAREVAESGDATQLLALLEDVAAHALRVGRSGLLLVLDELGKFLEFAALHPDRDDVYLLQQIAEAAARSAGSPLTVVALLHQGFHAYADRLPSAARQEWEKIAGRYEDIVFDQPLAHLATLVAGALNTDTTRVPAEVAKAAQVVRRTIETTDWYGPKGTCPPPLDLYPLHPAVLPVLSGFFARFGQHERSLFSFLLASEPFGLQAFADRAATKDNWYLLSDFYDYIRAVFGHRLAGASYRSHWLRIVETVDRVSDLTAIELHVLKTVAVLNVLDAEHLLADDALLRAASAPKVSTTNVNTAVSSLKRRGLLFDRGAAGGYCLWPSTSVNLESAFQAATRTLGPAEWAPSQLKPYLDESPVVARRHYIETGTLRHFEVRYAEPEELLDVVARPTEADGLVVVVLCSSSEERSVVLMRAQEPDLTARQGLLLIIPPPLERVVAELHDARCWQWVADNTLELTHDVFAASEVSRQVTASRHALTKRLDSLLGFFVTSADVEWWHKGRRMLSQGRGGVSGVVSAICDECFHDAPRVQNELLNRRTLSSAAAAARLRLIDGILSAGDQRDLGMPVGKAPPEKSMYLSVLSAGNVHRETDGQFRIAEPPSDEDPLHLLPALSRILSLLEEGGRDRRVTVSRILDVLQAPPYGVRAGVAHVLLAIVTSAHAHEIAVYEHGTFIPRFGPTDFLRLIKQPASFDFQLCRVAGVRAEVFAQLARVFMKDDRPNRRVDLLDVVRPLSMFAATLPEYSRTTEDIPAVAKKVRETLLVAREPAPLLFRDLPIACGLSPFTDDEVADPARARAYTDLLRAAMNDLRVAYPQLLERIRARVAVDVTSDVELDRVEIARRASRIVVAAREPHLQAFARCLADVALSDDAWAERVGSFVLSKPPGRWGPTDEARWGDEAALLGASFRRVEATAFADNESDPDTTAVRVGITRSDGVEEALVVRVRESDEPAVRALASRLEAILAKSGGEHRLPALARVLEDSLAQSGRAT